MNPTHPPTPSAPDPSPPPGPGPGRIDRHLTPQEAAALLGVSPKTVYRLVHSRRLGAVGVGTGKQRPRVHIPESELAEFLRVRDLARTA